MSQKNQIAFVCLRLSVWEESESECNTLGVSGRREKGVSVGRQFGFSSVTARYDSHGSRRFRVQSIVF